MQRRRWTYDAVGNRLSNQLNDSVIAAAYNNKNQLTATSPGGTLRWRGTLNEPGNVTFTSATVNGKPARMLAGNVFEADIPVASGQNDVTLVAKDVSNNSTTKVYRITVSGAGTTYTYDGNGNLTQKSDGTDTWDYVWNAENELKEVKKNSSTAAMFKYDPLGRRVERIDSATTFWVYDDQDLLREDDGSATVKYVQGPSIDEPIAEDNGAGLTYFHADGLGSIVAATNLAANVTLNRRYDSWGNLQTTEPTGGYAFTGREWDPETRLYYYRARYYAPDDARFVSEDPLGVVSGINLFQYVSSQPTFHSDPSGLVITITSRRKERWNETCTRGKLGCTTPMRQKEKDKMTGCNLGPLGWSFDVELHYILEIKYAGPPGFEFTTHDPEGRTLKDHEALHAKDLENGFGGRAVNKAIKTDCFTNWDTCESSRQNFFHSMYEYLKKVGDKSQAKWK